MAARICTKFEMVLTVVKLHDLDPDASSPTLSSCVKESMQIMIELWKVTELLASGAGGLQARFGQ